MGSPTCRLPGWSSAALASSLLCQGHPEGSAAFAGFLHGFLGATPQKLRVYCRWMPMVIYNEYPLVIKQENGSSIGDVPIKNLHS